MKLFRRARVLFTMVAMLVATGSEMVRAVLMNQKLTRDFKSELAILAQLKCDPRHRASQNSVFSSAE